MSGDITSDRINYLLGIICCCCCVLVLGQHSSSSSSSSASSISSCAPCLCHCPPPLSFLNLPTGFANLSTQDCGKSDPELENEMEKQYAELLLEELKLQEVVSEEQLRHMNATYREARRVGSQYQREAEKCNVATETCEEARERAEALLRHEFKLSSLWEQKALKLGWLAD